MGFNRLFRRSRLGAMPGPSPAPTPLKYSDYLAGAAIVTGIVGASAFVQSGFQGSNIVGFAGLGTTILTALSQWLQSKGD